MGPPEVIKARPVRSTNHSVSDFHSGNIHASLLRRNVFIKVLAFNRRGDWPTPSERISPFSYRGFGLLSWR
jgi:hypothetical protein